MPRVLVTGGTRGIGRAIVRRFARAGDQVIFCYRHNVDAAAEIQAELPNVESVQIDLRQHGAIEKLTTETATRLGGIDVLINSAGVYPHVEFLDTPASLAEDVVRVNFLVPFALMQAAVPHMPPEGGAIVNITSINATMPDAGLSAYDASKAALAQATRSAALELGPLGVRVNAVAPGLIDDPALESAAPQRRDAFLNHAPLHRLVSPEDVAGIVHFLASPEAAAITGQTIVVDAGVTLAGYTAG